MISLLLLIRKINKRNKENNSIPYAAYENSMHDLGIVKYKLSMQKSSEFHSLINKRLLFIVRMKERFHLIKLFLCLTRNYHIFEANRMDSVLSTSSLSVKMMVLSASLLNQPVHG